MSAPSYFVKKDPLNYVFVTDYGAVGDGVSDDTQAIRDAMEYAYSQVSSRSLAVYFPAGTYLVSSTLQMQPETTLIGEEGKSIIRASGTVAGDEFTLFKRSGATLELHAEGLTLIHNGVISPTPVYADSNGFDANQAVRVTIVGCQFVNFPNACITLGREAASAPGEIVVDRCFARADLPGLTGALFVDINSCSSLHVSNCSTDNIARSISIEPSDPAIHSVENVSITGNSFINGQLASISLTNTCIPIQLNIDTGQLIDNVTITGNLIDNCGNNGTSSQGYAILVSGSTGATKIKNVSIVGNVIRNWAGNANSHVVMMRKADAVSFTGNSVISPQWTASAEAGIFVDNLSDSVINGNIFTGTYDPAIVQITEVSGASSGNIISGNVADSQLVSGNSSGFLTDHYGAGSPENVQYGKIGSTFRRTDGGAGTSFYVKESGTYNTGWVAK